MHVMLSHKILNFVIFCTQKTSTIHCDDGDDDNDDADDDTEKLTRRWFPQSGPVI